MPTSIPILPTVSGLALDYDAWLVDIWGVVHNGEQAIGSACMALMRYRERGGIVMLISNSPRPSGAVREQMADFNVPRESYDLTVTSGDVSRSLLQANSDRAIFHLGPERDMPLLEGLDLMLTDKDEAELVILSGLYDDETETPDDYEELLQELKSNDLPMICANPDIMVERGAKLVYCAGAIAEAYEAIGGQVHYAGKPHIPIYELSFELIAQAAGRKISKNKILAIGDGLKTDLAGAAAAGLDALFIASGVHISDHGTSDLDGAKLARLFDGADRLPIGAQSQLMW